MPNNIFFCRRWVFISDFPLGSNGDLGTTHSSPHEVSPISLSFWPDEILGFSCPHKIKCSAIGVLDFLIICFSLIPSDNHVDLFDNYSQVLDKMVYLEWFLYWVIRNSDSFLLCSNCLIKCPNVIFFSILKNLGMVFSWNLSISLRIHALQCAKWIWDICGEDNIWWDDFVFVF